ncbi:MAG: amidohydrolase [Oscillospiraceae bacterium]|nr:amidohydrolase [Oscillospiraceae bacterium]
MSTKFYNAKILTMNNTDITQGEVWTDGDSISYVGEAKPVPENVTFEREIDLKGNLIIPAFKNAHSHSAMTFLRSYADDLPLHEWLHEQVFPMEAKLTGDDIYWLSRLAFMEYLSSGISACFDMYFEPQAVAAAAKDVGFRLTMCGSVNNFGTTPKILREYYEEYNNYDPLVAYKLGFHAEYTNDVKLMEEIAEMAKAYKAPVFAHNSETALEVEGCKERHGGMTPTELFESVGLYEYGGGGFHCVHMTGNDLDIFKRRGLWAVTNPASNCKLASGIAPLAKMLDLGINIAIGTDGAASNNALDMFREMYLAAVLQKILLQDAASMSAVQVLEAACKGGALAIGLDDCDTIAEGKKADLTVIDLNQPNMQPLNNIVKNIVYAGSKQNVALTMVNGRVLYENGNFSAKDSDLVYAKANEIIARMR